MNKMNKIKALELTLEKLRDPNVEYDWPNVESCNCGILAQVAMNKNKKSLFNEIFIKNQFPGTVWSDAARNLFKFPICSITKLPVSTIFDALGTIGFSKKEIIELENLSNIQICNSLNWELIESSTMGCNINLERNNRESVILYIQAWIEILKEQEPQIEKKVEEKPAEKVVYVTIDEKVKELVKEEKILN